MAYNSDGYIMFDFSDVDFRRATQTIEGLYDRCVKIIGTNKFILVINANGKTPLPSVCSFINNQYVIESCLYTFAITSSDTILIRRNEPDPSQLINDEIISPLFTWSSSKIDSELDSKADTSSLADYQPLLIPVSPISIDENDNISIDLSDYQPLLTAGDNISIVNNVISFEGIKSFTYTGDGNNPRTIVFPNKPKYVLGIIPPSIYLITGFAYGQIFTFSMECRSSSTGANRKIDLSYNDNEITLSGITSTWINNYLNTEYIVYYI